MKRRVLTILCCLSVFFTMNMKSNAQSILIHYWHFNNFSQGAMYTPTISPIPVDYTRIASPTASVLYTGIYGPAGNGGSYIDTLTAITTDYDTVNARMGQPDGAMIRARNQSDSMELLFNIPSTNYTNLQLTYGTESSSTTSGQLHQNFSYSTNGGTTWISTGTGLSVWTDSAWTVFNRVSVHIADPAASNNPNLVFRITFSGNNHTPTGKGNNRFDNITLEGDTLIASVTENVNQLATEGTYTLYPNPVTNTLNISSDLEGAKTVSIYNTVGQKVYEGVEDNKLMSIATGPLQAGLYFVSVRENENGSIRTLKFIKQ